jgi:hypothetical protein
MNKLPCTSLRRRLVESLRRTPHEEPIPSPASETAFKIGFAIIILASLAAVNWSLSNPISIYQIFRMVTSAD